MAGVSFRVDSEAGDSFILQSTWRTNGLPKVTQPVNPNSLTLTLAHSLLIPGSTGVAVLRRGWMSLSLVSHQLLGYLVKGQEGLSCVRARGNKKAN